MNIQINRRIEIKNETQIDKLTSIVLVKTKREIILRGGFFVFLAEV